MLEYTYNYTKALQAAALILQEHHRRMDYIRLIKILYIADRELLAESGRTLTGDKAVAMKYGPVLSKVYDLIREHTDPSSLAPKWNTVIQKDGYEVSLKGEVDLGQLTKAEVRKIRELCKKFHGDTTEDLLDVVHGFPEWKKAFEGKSEISSYPIPWETVLEAQGKADLIDEAQNLLADKKKADAAFME